MTHFKEKLNETGSKLNEDDQQHSVRGKKQRVIYINRGKREFKDFDENELPLPVMTVHSMITNKTLFCHMNTVVALRH